MGSRQGHAVKFAEVRIREMLVSGDLEPGQRVGQDSLADELGTTRVPIREAFKTLVADGLMRHEPNRGHFVSMLDGEELKQIYWLRGKVEDELVRTMGRPDDESVARAIGLNEAMGELAAKEDLIGLAEANRTFHFNIFGHSPRRYLFGELGRLWDRTVQYRAIYLRQPAAVDRVMAEHDAIIAAFSAGELAELGNLLAGQRESGMRSVLAVLDEGPETPGGFR